MFTVTRMPLIAGALVGLLAAGAARADRYDRSIDLVNRSSETIESFYASNVGTDQWGGDRLGRSVVGPGYHIRLDLDDGSGFCRFDFKSVMRNGMNVIKRNVDICTIERYTIFD